MSPQNHDTIRYDKCVQSELMGVGKWFSQLQRCIMYRLQFTPQMIVSETILYVKTMITSVWVPKDEISQNLKIYLSIIYSQAIRRPTSHETRLN